MNIAMRVCSVLRCTTELCIKLQYRVCCMWLARLARGYCPLFGMFYVQP